MPDDGARATSGRCGRRRSEAELRRVDIPPAPRRKVRDTRRGPALNFWRTIEHQHVKPCAAAHAAVPRGRLCGRARQLQAAPRRRRLDLRPGFRPAAAQRGMPKVARAFEWCAGPGFIGFSLLAHGLCDTLCLADVNPEAVAACRRTVARNRLEAKVAVYHSDNLEDIPAVRAVGPGGEQPAAFRRQRHRTPALSRSRLARASRLLRQSRVTSKPGGVVVLQENNAGSTPATFTPMIAERGVAARVRAGRRDTRTAQSHMYYLGIMRPGDPVPAWARAPDIFDVIALRPDPSIPGALCVSWRSMPACTTPPPRRSTTTSWSRRCPRSA